MKKIFIFVLILVLLPVLVVWAKQKNTETKEMTQSSSTSTVKESEVVLLEKNKNDAETQTPAKYVNLDVPFTSEIPNGAWVGPWKNACEEASVVMVNEYYLGSKDLTKAKAAKEMQRLFDIENKIYGSNADTSAARTNRLINDYMSFSSRVVDEPTFEQIKEELRAGRPVILPIYGYYLNNPNINFRVGGTYYHMFVIVGYDDDKEEFIVNDTGDHDTGLDYRYSYDIIRKSLGDFNHQTRRVTDPPRALFTKTKEQLVKVKGTNGLFLVKDGKSHYISHPKFVKQHGWSWSSVKEVERDWLNALPKGEDIRS